LLLTYDAENILQKHKLASKKVPMNYDNYEKKIVEVYAVAIDGWTCEHGVCNPGKIGRRDHLITLLDALVTGKCSWIVLSDDDLSERISNNHKRQVNGEQIYKPRKAMRRRKTDSAKSAQIIPDSDLEDTEQEDGGGRGNSGDNVDGEGAGNIGRAE
jgi:hypothetical protein